MTYRTQCPSVIVAKLGAVPLDVSDKFQEQPAKADVEAMALQILEETHPEVAQQNISVSFVQLAQTEEYKDIAPLLECNLCDYVKVEFERYNMSGDYKIVKTVFNVLLDRYDEMELGSLSTTLSQALNTK